MSSQAYQEIAPRLRGLREALELETEEMAADLGVDADTVRNYESGAGEIPVSYLFQVAQQYDIDLTVLISGDEAHLHNYSVVRKGRGMSVERRKDYDYKSLAYRFTGRRMEPFLVSVPPKSDDALTFHEHAGQEFIYMLEGRLEIRLGTNTEILDPGDSLYFSSRTPHALRSLSEQPAQFLDVII
ncbi:helix-turn-helix domain-containing protein [Desulfohalobium retbaense]|uniref:Transcriptional regulator, XRE family n=1 Tax=Desulfohalobium retbaense (strain ATCC 49708 / DSM 5692 / JCM 16813 / HR100) TaxID=485915 RepID=C8X111_DESRD|nr:XRE family transcriptional regulator [Desulfohalobium retbaense]ACV68108.1 transcriptional regulator, XRE family [Desulfohalobium retbaense DSM 5692]